MTGWRPYAALIAIAALVGVVVALVASGGPRFPERVPARAPGSPTATASSFTFGSPRATATPPLAASPSPTPPPADLTGVLFPLVDSWRPSGTTVVAQIGAAGESTLLAMPLAGGARPIELVRIPSGHTWDIRRDGGAIAFSLPRAPGTAVRRIALLDLRAGEARWLSADDPTVDAVSPIWSDDGASVFYTKVVGGKDAGIFRVRPDGSGESRIVPPSAENPPALARLATSTLLVWERPGRALAVQDLSTGTRLTVDRPASFQSWRSARPRILATLGATALGSGPLVTVDDVAGTSTTLLDRSITAADWDPTGTRIVAAGDSDASPLTLVDATGANRTTLEGTEGGLMPLWLRAGIVYAWRPTGEARLPEIRLVSPTGRDSRTLYKAEGTVVRLRFIAP